ncbi:pseudouridine synthase [Shouchella sp. JSM 1781072]|uniref:pseudouridine synthase n=1 Tax=Bacillaceae TaxID=186817 RepID=UPI000C0888F4|nr:MULTISPECIES: pseudouridine synthase [Bacillaceae]UTR04604.1 rRNA pseudouridine synthase [Alkalihalobacillus sp. LMS6]
MERLQKVIAQAGVASRRKAEEYITAGRVKVNGKRVTELGVKVNPNKDQVEVDGVPLDKEEPVYYLLYKPTGFISTSNDEKGRKKVTDLIDVPQRIYPVGRLDYDTSGLLLLTNDGDFANLLMHPKFKIEKEYVVKIKGIPDRKELKQLETGVKLDDGVTAPAKVKLLSSDRKKNTSIIRIIIHEGKNRQVRRMMEAFGYEVEKLKRERFSFLTLGNLNPGEYRAIKAIEIKQLKDLAVTKPS